MRRGLYVQEWGYFCVFAGVFGLRRRIGPDAYAPEAFIVEGDVLLTADFASGLVNAEAKGGFYGDDNGMPGHAAGLWSMSSPLGRALGGFMAKRQ
jgi:hypothetical protein